MEDTPTQAKLFGIGDGITKVQLTVLYGSKEARDTATRSGMEHGMVAGYKRLKQVLAVIQRKRVKECYRSL